MPGQVDWKRVVLVYVLQIYSYTAAVVVWVQLDVPRYVEYRSTVTLICNHSVSENVLHKIEFIRNEYKIFQYIKDRTPPTQMHKVPGAELQPTSAMNVIKLKDVGFEASGVYSCDVSMATPIYTVGSDSVNMEVIVPQSEDPRITFKKPYYVVGEILEANCTSSPAHPAPHITWFINGKEVDVFLVRTFPIKTRENQLMSTVAQLSIEVSALHAGENGRLEISCNSTIPTYPMQNGQYADFKSETKSIKIISVPLTPSTASSCHRENVVLLTISGIIATNGITNYLQSIVVKLLGLNLIVS